MQSNKHHGGIVLGQQQRYSIKQKLQGILRITSELSAEETHNNILFINNYI